MDTINTKKVTIIIPCFQEEKYIGKCLDSLLKGDYDLDESESEILVIDGKSTDKTQEIVLEYQKNHPFIKLVINEKRFAPFALNKGISIANGQIIIRIDAHCIYPPNYVCDLVFYQDQTNSGNIGGCWDTFPGSDTKTAKAIQLVMNHPLGMSGGTYRTLKGKSPLEVDTVPFGCWDKEIFNEIGNFDENFLRDQDFEHNVRIRKAGKKIILLPWLRIKYFARDTFIKAWKMFYQYGYWRPLLNKKHNQITNTRQLIPAIWVLGLLFTSLIAPLNSITTVIWISYLLLWLVPVLAVSFYQSVNNKSISLIPYLIWSFFIVHFSYGIGYLKGFFDVFLIRKEPNKFSTQSTR